MGRKLTAGLCAGLLATAVGPATAEAFCGFYVGSADAELVNNATVVVMMREGTTTALSMQNDYQGPTEDFAMVVPVPVVLQEENVKTLEREVFDRVSRLAAPRLVEYWEQDPCNQGTIGLGNLGTIGFGGGGGTGSGYGAGPGHVTVEAEFAVGEYDIVILGANDSAALDTWLREHEYNIPEGAEEVLRPYVAQGMKFFVAKVDAERATFEDGRAVLSPLRFHYEDESFRLPVRLGLLNSPGQQDLVVHVLARNQRYEVANYENVTIPTNIEVSDEVRTRFGSFYAALLDRTLERNPGAVVTEYSWQATGCDPCPGPVLSASDLVTLGADVVIGEQDPPATTRGAPRVRNDVRVVGDLSREIVRRVTRRHIAEVRFCYQQGLNRAPDLEGQVTTRFEINSTGAVTDAALEGGDLEDEGVKQCIVAATRRWRFPSGPGVNRVSVDWNLETQVAVARPWGMPGPYQSFVLTRLHYRYGKDGLDEDLVFRTADPIVGGREMHGEGGKLEEGARPASANNFQGRYIIRHAWEGPIECDEPQRGIWGGPPDDVPRESETLAATDTAMVDRGGIELASLVREDIPSLGLAAGSAQPATPEEPPAPAPPAPAASTDGGCAGCTIPGSPSGGWLLAPIVTVLLLWRRRR